MTKHNMDKFAKAVKLLKDGHNSSGVRSAFKKIINKYFKDDLKAFNKWFNKNFQVLPHNTTDIDWQAITAGKAYLLYQWHACYLKSIDHANSNVKGLLANDRKCLERIKNHYKTSDLCVIKASTIWLLSPLDIVFIKSALEHPHDNHANVEYISSHADEIISRYKHHQSLIL